MRRLKSEYVKVLVQRKNDPEGPLVKCLPNQHRSLLHGGYVNITKTWAKSLLKWMKYVKRKRSNAGKISPTQFAEIQVFLEDIKAQMLMKDIPDKRIIN